MQYIKLTIDSVRMLIRQILILSSFLFLLIKEAPLAAEIDVPDKIQFYLNQANIAVQHKDYPHACKVLQHAGIYSSEIRNEKMLAEIKNQTAKICAVAAKQDEQNLANLKESLTIFGVMNSCPQYKQSRAFCASASNYDQCMKIRYGDHYKIAENSGVCTFN